MCLVIYLRVCKKFLKFKFNKYLDFICENVEKVLKVFNLKV